MKLMMRTVLNKIFSDPTISYLSGSYRPPFAGGAYNAALRWLGQYGRRNVAAILFSRWIYEPVPSAPKCEAGMGVEAAIFWPCVVHVRRSDHVNIPMTIALEVR